MLLENNNPNVYTEETRAAPNLENGRQLLEVEHLLQNNTNFKTTVIRFGGLIGEDRQPVRSLSGNKMLQNPTAPINLIHQQDCIGIIETIIDQLKNISQIEHSRHRSIANFFVNVLCGLIAYCRRPSKPSLGLDDCLSLPA